MDGFPPRPGGEDAGAALTELAAILAMGYLRLRASLEIALPADGPDRALGPALT